MYIKIRAYIRAIVSFFKVTPGSKTLHTLIRKSLCEGFCIYMYIMYVSHSVESHSYNPGNEYNLYIRGEKNKVKRKRELCEKKILINVKIIYF